MTTRKYVPFVSAPLTAAGKDKPLTVDDNGEILSTDSVKLSSIKDSAGNSKIEMLGSEVKITTTEGGTTNTCVISKDGVVLDGVVVPSLSNIPEIVNNLDSTATTKTLAAAQGKAIKDLLDTKVDTAGTGLTKTGTTLKHSNNVTAATDKELRSFSYDAQGHVTDSDVVEIIAELTSEDDDKVLSASMGKKLNDEKVPIQWTSAESGYILGIDTTTNKVVATQFKIPFASITGQPTDNTNLTTALNAKLGHSDIDDTAYDVAKLWSSKKVKDITDALGSVAAIQVVATLPATPANNTMYYVGTASPYTIKLSANGTVYNMGTTDIDLSNYVKKDEIVNNLTSYDTNVPLSANQGRILNEKITAQSVPIVDNLTSTDSDKALSARQGNILNNKFLPLAGGAVTGNVSIAGSLGVTGTAGVVTKRISNPNTIKIESKDLSGNQSTIELGVNKLSLSTVYDSHTTTLELVNGWARLNGKALITEDQGFDAVYPIGSIYINVGDSCPFTIGTWNRISNGTFLMASNTAGGTGGTNSMTLTTDNLPKHSHTASASLSTNNAGGHTHTRGSMDIYGTIELKEIAYETVGRTGGALYKSKAGNAEYTKHSLKNRNGTWITFNAGDNWTGETSNNGSHSHTVSGSVTVGQSGNGQAFDNRPQYLAVSMWQRVA